MSKYRTNYLSTRYADLAMRCGVKLEDVMPKADALHAQLRAQGWPNRTINHYRLDNPFMQEHARATLLARAQRELSSHWTHTNNQLERCPNGCYRLRDARPQPC